MVHRHLPLDPGLQRQHEGPDQPLQLLDNVLDTPAALGLVGRRGLGEGLNPQGTIQLIAQTKQRRLVVGLQDHLVMVAQPTDTANRLLYCVSVMAAIAKDRVRQDGAGAPRWRARCGP